MVGVMPDIVENGKDAVKLEKGRAMLLKRE
jgi:hypothetical protein